MNHRFAQFDPQDRRLAFGNAAIARRIDPAILEKDFWVSWLLGLLFELEGIGAHLVFKGGTSLSKVFGVIDRFSEDIDLCVSPAFVGADPAAFDALTGRTRRNAAMLEMQRLCADRTQQVLMPALENAITAALGTSPHGAWLRYELDADARSPVVYFRYPAGGFAGFEYLQREVKLELGTLTDQQPTGRYPVRPLVADDFPAVFGEWSAEVIALELQRTFWEKATILHAEFHRPPEQPTPIRYARHYFDMVRLLAHADAARFLADEEQCARVVDWKSRAFTRTWARYELAHRGSFRLLPSDARRNALAQDYATMRPMFMSEPPPFAQLLDSLARAEATLNGWPRPSAPATAA